ncbi:MAG: hypothetical protein M0R06_17215 [Sphaerochaeta sp.]|jgi:hypothetical protein|nr:hypothetical protein [Sphaerochaeta sp.]
MTVINGYCTLADIKNRHDLTTTDATRDAGIEQMIEAASRWIDNTTGRQFYATIATRYFTAHADWQCKVDDLLSVTTLKTDTDGDRTYENTWTITDFELWPYNSTPYTRIEIAPRGTYAFPLIRKGVEIAGKWGYGEASTTSTATLNEDLDASETGVDVSAGTAFSTGQRIRIDSEDMLITNIATNTLTVRRAQNGTTGATHTTGAAIAVITPPDVIEEACALITWRLYKRNDAVFGVSSTTALGKVDLRIPKDEDVARLLSPFVRMF